MFIATLNALRTSLFVCGMLLLSAATVLAKEQNNDIDPSGIAKTLSLKLDAFQNCYNVALKSNPKLGGELKVKFTILETGKVKQGNISFSGSASSDRNLSSCIHSVFLMVEFPKPKGGEVHVNYPLAFTLQN